MRDAEVHSDPGAPGADLVEQLAADGHNAWMDAQRARGITSRLAADGEEQMVPYEQLSDAAQELDRCSVRAVLIVLRHLGFLAQQPTTSHHATGNEPGA